MLGQNALFRRRRSARSRDLLRDVTVDPAMLTFLNGIDNRKGSPNENYAREVMELFTLGADRGAYTETDVRQAAKALTGWRADWVDSVGLTNFRFDADRHDTTTKTIFGKSGNYGWQDVCNLCLEHPLHPSFFVTKLWSYFVPVAARRRRRRPRCRRPTSTRGYRHRARWSRRSSGTRASTTARRWSSRRSSTTPACCARSGAASTPTTGPGSSGAPARRSSIRPTSPAGTTRAGSTPSTWRGRWHVTGVALAADAGRRPCDAAHLLRHRGRRGRRRRGAGRRRQPGAQRRDRGQRCWPSPTACCPPTMNATAEAPRTGRCARTRCAC